MKKILFLIPNLSNGGAERVLVNLVNNLDPKKYDITVQTLFDIGINRQYLNQHVHYIHGAKREFRGYSHLQKILPPEWLYRGLIKDRYDIAIAYLEGTATRIMSGCHDATVKTVAWVHTGILDEKQFIRCFRTLQEAQSAYGSMTAVITVSEQVRNSLLRFVACKAQTLYNVNETETILQKSEMTPPDFEKSDEPCICTVGNIRAVKGYDRLLHAHKRLLDEGMTHRIYIIGVGEEQKKLQAEARRMGIEDSFRMIGFRDNPYQYVARCDLYVCSSQREGFSTAVTEALIVGTPVISTDCSGAKELLGENNEYGVVVENSEEGIYEGMKRMLSNPELMAYYKRQAVLRGQQFSREVTVKAVERMLDSL